MSQIFLPLHDQKKNTFATVDLYVSVFSCLSFQVLIFQWKIQLNGLLPCLTTDTFLEFPPWTLKNLVKSSSLVSLAQYYSFLYWSKLKWRDRVAAYSWFGGMFSCLKLLWVIPSSYFIFSDKIEILSFIVCSLTWLRFIYFYFEQRGEFPIFSIDLSCRYSLKWFNTGRMHIFLQDTLSLLQICF